MEKEWMRFCFDYVFNQVKVKKLIGLVSSANQRALKLDKHFGYVEEGIIKDAAPDGDLHILTMTKEQCRVLNK
jgi:RimJ/RimL family protein N-acetyltransferase